MSDQLIMSSFRYSLSVVVVLVLFVWWNLSGRVALLEQKHKINSDVIEGLCGCNPYANTSFRNGMGYQQSDSITGSRPGVARFAEGGGQGGSCGTENFFGTSEPPVFYDIGDVRAARTTRGWSTGYMTDAAGNPVYGADGKPVMASKASHYKGMKARKALYGGPNMGKRMDMTDVRMRDAGYHKNAAGNWQINAEGMFDPVEGAWFPDSSVQSGFEGYLNDEELLLQ